MSKVIEGVRLEKITVDEGLQARAALDLEAVSDYAKSFQNGDEFPPVVVFQSGDVMLLADGFHRFKAAQQAGNKTILAEVRQGTRDDALWFALGSNILHGVRRTNRDKRRVVKLALQNFPDRSDRDIARQCGVSHPLVADIRAEVERPGGNSSTCESDSGGNISTCQAQRRLGSDGKSYPMPQPGGNSSTCQDDETRLLTDEELLEEFEDELLEADDDSELPGGNSSNLQPKPEPKSADAATDRARKKIPELLKSLRLQLGNLYANGRFDASMEAIAKFAQGSTPKQSAGPVADGIAQAKPVLDAINLALRMLKAVEEMPGTELVVHRERAIRSHLENAKSELVSGTPAKVCHKCKGKPDGCTVCGNLGWLVKANG